MKKQLFDEIITYLTTEAPTKLEIHSVNETDEIISYSFENTPDIVKGKYEQAKETFKSQGYKGEELLQKFGTAMLYKSYYTVLYNKVKDKISIGELLMGYSYSGSKKRFYPYRRKTPILCYSKKIYCFHHKNKPRILLGSHAYDTMTSKIIKKVILKIPYSTTLRIPYHYLIGAKTEHEAMEKYFGQSIPSIFSESPHKKYEIFYSYLEWFGKPHTRHKNLQIELNIGELRATACDGGSNDPGLFHLF